ncbi:MAG: cupin domain-containing protein [Acidimicrobiales bacterium]|nr:cupin domain-containing protein [Acidimicrobiales bacterium]
MNPTAKADVDQIGELLGLEPHPEGGRYAETWRAVSTDGTRSAMTAIYFLLTDEERSHWHSVDATKIWHHYAGAPLVLETSDGTTSSRRVLGADVLSGERPQLVVGPGEWQAASTSGAWTLVGYTVTPGFEFSGFELATPEWAPSAPPEPS